MRYTNEERAQIIMLAADLWGNMKEYIDSVKPEGVFHYKELNVTNFISKYYPGAFEKDTLLIRFVYDAFKFFDESEEEELNLGLPYVPYYPGKYSTEEKDEIEMLIDEVSEHYKFTRIKYNYEDILYKGRKRHKAYILGRMYDVSEVEPKQSLKKQIIISENYDWAHNDFLYKTILLNHAVMHGQDKKYNRILLEEYYEICNEILNDEYCGKTISEIMISDKRFPLALAENNIRLEKKHFLECLCRAECYQNLTELYKISRNEEVLLLILRLINISLKAKTDKNSDIVTEKKYFFRLRKKDLIKTFTENFQDYFDKIKTENVKLYQSVKEKNKEYDIFKEGKVEFENNEAIDYSRMKIDLRGIILHDKLPYSTSFRLSDDNGYRKWLIDFLTEINEKTDDYFKDNDSYYEMTKEMDIKPLEARDYLEYRDCFKGYIPEETRFDLMPVDTDFTLITKWLKIYCADDYIKISLWQIAQSKDILNDFVNVYLAIFNDPDFYNEVYNYILKTEYPIEDTTYDKLIYAFSEFFKDFIKHVKSPQEYIEYLNYKKRHIDSYDLDIRNALETFLDNQTLELQETVKQWDTYKPEAVREKLIPYFEELKPKIFNIYEGKITDEEYEKIIKNTISFISTGEAMYHQFVDKNIELGDYGSLAINYHKALEWLINSFIYVPYRKIKLDNLDYNKKGYFGKSQQLIIDKKNCPKKNLEMGILSRFLGNLDSNNFKDKNYKEVKTFYQEHDVDIKKMVAFFKEVIKISKWRNECAHPEITNKERLTKTREALYESQAKDVYELIFGIKEVFI